MNNQLLESDREYVKLKVCLHIDRFFDDFKKVNEELFEQKRYIGKLEYSKRILARAYAVKLGILVTKKQFRKMMKENQKQGEEDKEEK